MRRVVASLVIAVLLLVSAFLLWIAATRGRDGKMIGSAKAKGVTAPELTGGGPWINSKPLTVRGLRGKVVLIDFWDYTCVNCIRTFPYIKEWYRRYSPLGLVIIGVHTPEFDFAKQPKNVEQAAKRFGLKYPIVLDNDYAIWHAFHNQYWPRHYLIDKNGVIIYDHIGEGGYEHTEAQIQRALREIDPHARLPKVMEPVRGPDKPGAVCYPTTPELYAGHDRGVLGNPEGYRPGLEVNYLDPGHHRDGEIYAAGRWQSAPEALISTSDRPAQISLRYHAIDLNVVLRPERGEPLRVTVTQDGRPVAKSAAGDDLRVADNGATYLEVDQPRMYQVTRNPEFGTHELSLTVDRPGLGVYAFTFGSCEVE
jgi:thiol-disulfide isomerase/thioredoxin